jgi:hypothetical protein
MVTNVTKENYIQPVLRFITFIVMPLCLSDFVTFFASFWTLKQTIFKCGSNSPLSRILQLIQLVSKSVFFQDFLTMLPVPNAHILFKVFSHLGPILFNPFRIGAAIGSTLAYSALRITGWFNIQVIAAKRMASPACFGYHLLILT